MQLKHVTTCEEITCEWLHKAASAQASEDLQIPTCVQNSHHNQGNHAVV